MSTGGIIRNQSMDGGGLYDRAVNVITRNRNPLRNNEKHPILYTKDGFMAGNYLGPGTDLLRKIKEGVEPIGLADKTAQAHDLRYSLASSPADVRVADQKMISKLNEIKRDKSDYKFNIYQGKVGIKAKMLLEDRFGLRPDFFTTYGNDYEPDDVRLLRAKLSDLEQQGFGRIRRSYVY